MKVATLYLDTSIIGGYFDDEWRDATRELFYQTQAGRFRFVSSDLVAREIEDAPEQVRNLFDDTFTPELLLDVTVEIEDLAVAYLSQRVVPPHYADDARHVAICTVARIDYLVSWNFQHLVNVQREAGRIANHAPLGWLRGAVHLLECSSPFSERLEAAEHGNWKPDPPC
jgi:predicted nucleic acid-binding protein